MLEESIGTGVATSTPSTSEEATRQQAIKQIGRKRRFWFHTALSALAMLILVTIWASAEYHNAGGWPTSGFSQSSGIHHVWNSWIIYPVIAWLFVTAARAWAVFGRRKPITDAEIDREIQRQAGRT